jgi:activating signal cointegrator complex subunit 1
MPKRKGYRGGRRQAASNDARGPRLTHFLCLPLVNEGSRPQLEQAMEVFVQQPRHNVFHEAAIRPIGTFHLTLGMMSLTTEEKLQEAIQFLNEIDLQDVLSSISTRASSLTPDDSGIEANVKLHISLNSLAPMDVPEKTRVLYSVPDDSTDRLQHLGEKLQLLFREKELVVDEKRELKLHATVVNTTYSQRFGFPRHFDATRILEQAKDLVWAKDVRLDRVAICKMGAKEVKNAEGVVVGAEYEEIASVSLPD